MRALCFDSCSFRLKVVFACSTEWLLDDNSFACMLAPEIARPTRESNIVVTIAVVVVLDVLLIVIVVVVELVVVAVVVVVTVVVAIAIVVTTLVVAIVVVAFNLDGDPCAKSR